MKILAKMQLILGLITINIIVCQFYYCYLGPGSGPGPVVFGPENTDLGLKLNRVFGRSNSIIGH